MIESRHSVTTYFDRGLARSRRPPCRIQGESCRGEDGLVVQFSLDFDGGVIRKIGFRASTCVTLVAYAEFLAERTAGRPLRQVLDLHAGELVEGLAGVPLARRGHAMLPVRALRSAVSTALISEFEALEPVKETR